MGTPTRVLVLGGGYVTIALTKALRRKLEQDDVLDVTVVSRDNFHVFHGFVSEMLTGRIQPGQIISPARRIFAPARLHVGDIEDIDLTNQTVTTSRHLDGRQHVLPYDHLVLALGSVDNLDLYPGIAEHSFKLKTYDECFRLRNHIIEMLELADIESDPVERRRLLTFVVAGAGYAGVEVASDLIDYLKLVTEREYRYLKLEEMRVILVHPGDHILPELYAGKGAAGYGAGHPRLVAVAERHLHELGVEIRTGARVAAATPDEVVLQSGERIATRTIISAVGTKTPAILDTLPLPKDGHGRIVADTNLNVQGYTTLWAAGDCASVPHPRGGTCPPVGIYALAEGKLIGKNIIRRVYGRPLLTFRYAGLGQACAIGHRFAVGEIRGIEFTGLFCWFLWRAILFKFVPTTDRRIRLLADWLIWPLVGRDITEFRIGDSHRVSHRFYEPGEVIVRKGDVSRLVYVIQSGEVEVEGDGTGVSALTVGQHFGNGSPMRSRRITATVWAKTAVRLIAMGHGDANAIARPPAEHRG